MWLGAAEYISSKGEPQWLKKFEREASSKLLDVLTGSGSYLEGTALL